MKLAFALLLATTAYAADSSFEHLVKGIEAHYGTRRMHIPLMGVANFALKIAHPAGAAGFKIAVFEGLEAAPESDFRKLEHLMHSVEGPHLQPFVRTVSRDREEATYIFTGELGKQTRMLIATFNRHEATVIEVQVTMDVLLQTISHADTASKDFGPKDAWWDR